MSDNDRIAPPPPPTQSEEAHELERIASDDAVWQAACAWSHAHGNDLRTTYRAFLAAVLRPAEPASGEAEVEAQILSDTLITVQAERNALRSVIAEARKRLAKGRALWNGPCHECDAVLAPWDFTAADPPPPPQEGKPNEGYLTYTAIPLADALRQRADEATRNENIGCAALVERMLQRAYPMDSAYEPIVAAIRARIAR